MTFPGSGMERPLQAIDHENYRVDDAPVQPDDDHAASADARKRMLPGYLDPALDFFDVFLRGQGQAGRIPKIRWELVHGEGMLTAGSWPPPGATERTLFLAGERLDAVSPAVPDVSQWTHNPADPVPSAVANPFAFLAEYPDESGTGDRADVLVFTAPEAAASPVDLAGPVAFEADFSSTAPTADLFARLLDLAPDGTAHLIAKGQVHARTESGRLPVSVPMGHAGYRLRPGHRLRLHLASSDFPEYVTDPGTGEHPWLAAGGKPAQHSIRLGGQNPARLRITVNAPGSTTA
jgi:putative CocE/NonD family hydrolase